jgi:hypothetical protein
MPRFVTRQAGFQGEPIPDPAAFARIIHGRVGGEKTTESIWRLRSLEAYK